MERVHASTHFFKGNDGDAGSSARIGTESWDPRVTKILRSVSAKHYDNYGLVRSLFQRKNVM